MAIYGQRSDSESSGEKCPPGFHRAVLIGMFDVGNQPGFKADDSPMHKVVLVWEMDKFDSKGRAFTMLDSVASYLSGPSAKKKSKFSERVEALIGRPLTEDEAKNGVDDSFLLLKTAMLLVAPPGADSKWPKITSAAPLSAMPGAVGILGKQPVTEGNWPKHIEGFVTKARAKAVGGWKAPTATPPNKSAPAASQGGALPSQEGPADPDGSHF